MSQEVNLGFICDICFPVTYDTWFCILSEAHINKLFYVTCVVACQFLLIGVAMFYFQDIEASWKYAMSLL